MTRQPRAPFARVLLALPVQLVHKRSIVRLSRLPAGQAALRMQQSGPGAENVLAYKSDQADGAQRAHHIVHAFVRGLHQVSVQLEFGGVYDRVPPRRQPKTLPRRPHQVGRHTLLRRPARERPRAHTTKRAQILCVRVLRECGSVSISAQCSILRGESTRDDQRVFVAREHARAAAVCGQMLDESVSLQSPRLKTVLGKINAHRHSQMWPTA